MLRFYAAKCRCQNPPKSMLGCTLMGSMASLPQFLARRRDFNELWRV
jgi:hypothetical protein